MNVLQNERHQIFKEDIVGAHLAAAFVAKMATLLGVSRTAVSKVMTTNTNHGRTYQLGGIVVENQN